MAQSASPRRRPRIRKSAPTIRERVEQATKAQEQPPKKQRMGRLLGGRANRLKQLRLSQRKPVKALIVPFSYLKRGLAWIMPSYFVNSWRELRQVNWPKRRETWRLTLAVFVFATVFGALVAGVDKGLDELFKKVILK